MAQMYAACSATVLANSAFHPYGVSK